jgi:hypothetical protein
MKLTYLIVMAIVIGGCSTHPVRCGGALRPINKAAVSAKPGSSAAPAAASGHSAVPPAEPRS